MSDTSNDIKLNRNGRRQIKKKLGKKIDIVWKLNQAVEQAITPSTLEAALKELTDYTKTLKLDELVLIDEYILSQYGTRD